MGLSDSFAKITDPYDRKARLYPALLALLPLVVMLVTLYASTASTLTNIVGTVFSLGGLFMMMNISREMGKRLEPKVYETWGGKPTTLLLRHRDKRLDGVTKRRYHKFLSSKIEVRFPDSAQETSKPDLADEVYQSATRWLLNKTRDTKKFKLLFNENITYGFRRNALGVKNIGLIISGACTLWVLITHQIIQITNPFFNYTAFATLPDTAISSLATSISMLFIWFFFFTKTSLQTAAFTYAETLLRACDEL
jgi:hypothetical protein